MKKMLRYIYLPKNGNGSGYALSEQQIEEETETERITLERNEPDESVGTDH